MNFLVYGLRYWLSRIKDDKSNEFFFWLLCWNAGMFLLLFVCLFFGPFTFLSFDYSVKKRESRPQRKPSFKRLRAEGVPALIHWSIDWLIDWLIDLFIYLFVRSFVRSFIYLFIYLFIMAFNFCVVITRTSKPDTRAWHCCLLCAIFGLKCHVQALTSKTGLV